MARVQVGLETTSFSLRNEPPSLQGCSFDASHPDTHIWREIIHPAGPPLKPHPSLPHKYRPAVKQGTIKGFSPNLVNRF